MLLYRFESPGDMVLTTRKKFRTLRYPKNVIFLVDNLWEWKRPDGYPNRRFAVFASPTPELARGSSNKEGRVFRVEIVIKDNCLIGQLNIRDAKYHRDCRTLTNLLEKYMGDDWVDNSLEEKASTRRLCNPCLLKEEVERLFQLSPLANIRDEVWNEITFWNDVQLVPPDSESLAHPEGEVFFEADEWRLIEI